MFGQVLLAVVAVAVTIIATPAATAALGSVLGGALAGAAGSIASQAVGVATGIQDKFSFKQVALAAIGGGVGGGFNVGLGPATKVTGLKSFAGAALRGAAQNAVTQGIGVATGLQDKFSWVGVAAAGIGAGIGGAFDDKFGGAISKAFGEGKTGAFAANIAQSSASAIANAATRSAIDGSNFGDNLIAAIPDVIGQTLGSALGQTASGSIGALPNLGPLGKVLGFIGQLTDDVVGGVVETVGDTVAGAVKSIGKGADFVQSLFASQAQQSAYNLNLSGTFASGDFLKGRFSPQNGFERLRLGADGSVIQLAQLSPNGLPDFGRKSKLPSFPNLPSLQDLWDTPKFHIIPNDANPIEHAKQILSKELAEIEQNALTALQGATKATKQYIATEAAKKLADLTISYVLENLAVSSTARELLTDFRNGTGPVIRRFDENSDAVRELFAGSNREYFNDHVDSLVRYAISPKKYAGQLNTGDVVTEWVGADFGVGDFVKGSLQSIGDSTIVAHPREFVLPVIIPGQLNFDTSNVIGSFTFGTDMRVSGDWLKFRSENNMTLSSFAGENLLKHGLVVEPQAGQPFSMKTQIFEYTRPNNYRPFRPSVPGSVTF